MSYKNFELGLQFLFPAEGGYSNHKSDLGGATNMGITQDTYNSYLKRKKYKFKAVKYITREEAKEIYYEDYWKASGADNIVNPQLAIAVFDTAVLHGITMARCFYRESGGNLNKFLALRKKNYDEIVRYRPSQRVFYKGWNNRVDNLKKYLDNIDTIDSDEDSAFTLNGKVEYMKNYNSIMSKEDLVEGLLKKLLPFKYKINDTNKLFDNNTGSGHWVTIDGNHVFIEN